MITREQIEGLGYAIFQRAMKMNRNNEKSDRVAMQSMIPCSVEESFVKKTKDMYVSFRRGGTMVETCKYNPLKGEYLITPMTSVFIGIKMKQGSIDEDEAYEIGDTILHGIERGDLQLEREFTYKESHDHDYEMEL